MRDDELLRSRIEESPTLLKLAGGEMRVNTALGGELLKGLIGALKSLDGSDEQKAVDFLNTELNRSGGAAIADDTSDELRNRIDGLTPDELSDLSSKDVSVDYEYDPNEGLVVKAQKNVKHEQDNPGLASSGPGPS